MTNRDRACIFGTPSLHISTRPPPPLIFTTSQKQAGCLQVDFAPEMKEEGRNTGSRASWSPVTRAGEWRRERELQSVDLLNVFGEPTSRERG